MFHYVEIFRKDTSMTIEEIEKMCKNISPDAFVECTGTNMVMVKFPTSQPSVVDLAKVFPNSEIKPIPDIPVTIVSL